MGHFEFPSTQASLSPSTGSAQKIGAQAATGNQPIITDTGAQSRPAVALDAKNPARRAIALNDPMRNNVIVSMTQDGGTSWTSTTLTHSVNGVSYSNALNASLTYDNSGQIGRA